MFPPQESLFSRNPAPPAYLSLRPDLVNRILDLITGRNGTTPSNCLVVGPRRTGKSSLLEAVAWKLDGEYRQFVPVTLNCVGMPARIVFAEALVDNTIQAYMGRTGDHRYWERIKGTLSRKKNEVIESVSEVSFQEFAVRLNARKTDEDSLIIQGLESIEKLGDEKNCHFVIMMHEFSDLLEWGNKTLGRIVATIQSQKRVSYVLTGSAMTVLRDLQHNHKSPFYPGFVEVDVDRIQAKSAEAYMKKAFEESGLQVNEASLRRLVSYCDGNFGYLNRMGFELFMKAKSSGTVTQKLVDQAYLDMVKSLNMEFELQYARFHSLERLVLFSLRSGGKEVQEIRREIRGSERKVFFALSRLIAYEAIERVTDGRYRLSDSVFANWLQKRYGPQLR